MALLEGEPEDMETMRHEARGSWHLIRVSLSQGGLRAWRCRSCDNLNEYQGYTFASKLGF